MPYYWTRIESSPPEQRRDEVARISAEANAALLGPDTYYDEQGRCWALVRVPDDPQQQREILRRLKALEWRGLSSASEHGQGKRPPASGSQSRPG